MEICVNLEFGDGNFESGFDEHKFAVTFVTLQNQITQLSAQLSPNTEIPVSYELWKQQYYSLLSKNVQRGFTNNQVTHISERDCRNEAENLRHQMHQWLQPLLSKLSSVLQQYPDSEIRLVIHTKKVTSSATKNILHRLPWHEWDFFTEDLPSQNYTKEAALCFNSHKAKAAISTDASTADESSQKIRRVRIISIFGDSEGIDTHADKELLQKLKKRGAELIPLTEPSRADFNMLWEEACDILFFAGHSETQNDIQNDTQTGVININRRDSLSLTDIKKTLSAAIAKGLKLAIFNSCDGLGLARDLAELNLGYIIVWREVVPDIIAQKFIRYFLSSFASGKSLFTSVGEARDKLLELADEQDLQNQLPGITWLPVICQNTTGAPPTWSDLGGLTGELPDNPYRGLSAFREEDAAFYFGREKFIASLREAVNNKPLVAVIGASGSGKSSVVFAGLLPKLRNAGNIGIVSFRPENKPFDNLAVALSDISDKSILQRRKVRSKIDNNRLAQIDLELDWHDDETKLCDFIQTLIFSSKYQRLVLVADQFEELYTLTPETERQSFLKALYFTIKYAKNFTLVLTLRADFLGIVLNSLLGKALQEHTPLLLTPMESAELRDAIEKPALKMKVELQSGLTNKLIDDLGSHPGRLPLLEFALTQLWEKQENWYLTHQAYEEIGGLEKALAKHADEVLDALQLQDLDNIYKAEQIFIQLVSPGAGTEDTRRVATRQDVGEKNWDLVQKLADKRLVVTGRDETNKVETVEIVHEALIREWGTFRKWIENNREFRVWQERLKQDEREWEKNNKNPDSLLQGTALSVAEDWYKQRGEELTDKEQYFIKKSIAQREKQQQQQKFRRNLTIFALVMGLLVVSFFAGISEIRRNDAELRQLSIKSVQMHDAGSSNEALVGVIKAGQKLQRNIFSLWAEPDTKIEVISALQSQLDFQPTVITHNPKGHTGNRYGSVVYGVIVSRDCKTLASIGDKAVKLWDVATGTNIHTYTTGQVYSAIFSNDGKTFASASDDNTVKLWDVATGTSIYTLKGHTGSVYGVVFSNDGKILASASNDKTVKLWDVATGNSIKTLKGNTGKLNGAIFSHDSKTLAFLSDHKTVKLWNVATGNPIKTLKGHTGSVTSVIFSNDDKTLASASDDKTVKLWDVVTGNSIKTLKGHTGSVTSVIFSNDSKTLASASDDKTVKLWDATTGASIKTLEGHTGSVKSVIFSNDSKTLASASDDKTVKLWDAINGASIKTLEGHTGSVTSVIFSSDGKTLASVSDDKTVKLWDAAIGTSVKTLKVRTDRVTSVIFSNDSKTFASVSDDNTIKLWDAATGNSITTLKGDTNMVTSVIFSNDGKTLASTSDDNTVKLWDVATGNSNKTLKVSTDSVNSVIFSNDSKNLASASDDKTVKLWDVATGNPIKTFKGHTGGVNSVIFSKDGKTLASASDDKTVKLWNVATGNSIKTLKGHTGRVNNVIFSNDGKTLASASTDRTVKLWDAATGALIKTFKGHTSKVNSVIFSNDGKSLASASNDKMVKLWDRTTGNSIKTLRRPSSVKNLSFFTDDKIIRFVSNGDTVRLWDINSGQVSTIASLEASSDYLLDASISPNSKQIASASSDNTVKLWRRPFQGTPVTLKGHTAEVLSVSFSPNHKILASASSDATIKLWDTSKVKEIKTLKGHSASVNSVRFSPDGKIIASASDDKTVKLWDAKIGKVIKTLERHTNWVNSVSFSPDGKTIVSASSDGTVIFWDVAKGSYIKEHKEEATRQTNTDVIDLEDILDAFESFNMNENKPPAINSVSFSPDGKTLAFATNDKVVKILDVNSNKILFTTPKRHEGKVNSVNFSPDGKIIVSASDSTKNTIGEKQSLNNIKLWDAATGREITNLGKVLDSINSVSFSSDSKTIVAPSNDGTYIVWNFDLDDLLKRGCDQLQRDLHNLKEIDRSDITDKDRLLCKN